MTRYIDADALMRKAVEKFYITNYFTHISKMIDNAPTIDAVEVVRCENCLKQGSDDCPMFNREWRTIMRGNECVDDFIFHDLTSPSGFCNYGERKSNVSKEEKEYLNKAFPEHDGGEWFDITDIMTKGETE